MDLRRARRAFYGRGDGWNSAEAEPGTRNWGTRNHHDFQIPISHFQLNAPVALRTPWATIGNWNSEIGNGCASHRFFSCQTASWARGSCVLYTHRQAPVLCTQNGRLKVCAARQLPAGPWIAILAIPAEIPRRHARFVRAERSHACLNRRAGNLPPAGRLVASAQVCCRVGKPGAAGADIGWHPQAQRSGAWGCLPGSTPPSTRRLGVAHKTRAQRIGRRGERARAASADGCLTAGWTGAVPAQTAGHPAVGRDSVTSPASCGTWASGCIFTDGDCQLRPSRAIRRSAASGPQVPAT